MENEYKGNINNPLKITEDRIINYQEIKSFLQLVKCSICHEILYNPYECDQCGSLMCSECLVSSIKKDNQICPKKCQNIKFSKCKVTTQRLLNLIMLRCINYPYCNYEDLYSKIIEHEKQCQYKNKNNTNDHSKLNVKSDDKKDNISILSANPGLENLKGYFVKSSNKNKIDRKNSLKVNKRDSARMLSSIPKINIEKDVEDINNNIISNNIIESNTTENNTIENNTIEENIIEENKSNLPFLLQENKKDNLNLILQFLSLKEQMSLFCTNKNFKKYLCIIIEKFKKRFNKLNRITLSSSAEQKLNEFRKKYTLKELKCERPKFKVSKGAMKTLELLNADNYNKVFMSKEISAFTSEIAFIYRVFMLFISRDDIAFIKDDMLFWNTFCDFILKNNKGKNGNFLKNSIQKFNFSSENIYKIKRIINKKEDKINPIQYAINCGTTGLFSYSIKEALEYSGLLVNSKMNIPCILYSNLEYVALMEKRINKYIEFLKK